MTRTEAYALLPHDAKWSCCFGNPGEEAFDETWRLPNGDRWVITKRGAIWSLSEIPA